MHLRFCCEILYKSILDIIEIKTSLELFQKEGSVC